MVNKDEYIRILARDADAITKRGISYVRPPVLPSACLHSAALA